LRDRSRSGTVKAMTTNSFDRPPHPSTHEYMLHAAGLYVTPGPVIEVDGRFVLNAKGDRAGGSAEAFRAEQWARSQ
jgi:hypothetical protein